MREIPRAIGGDHRRKDCEMPEGAIDYKTLQGTASALC